MAGEGEPMTRIPRTPLVVAFVVGLLGLLGCVLSLHLLGVGATVKQVFPAGSAVAVDLSPDRRTIVWGPTDGSTPDCVVNRAAGSSPFDNSRMIESLRRSDVRTVSEDRSWRGLALLTAEPAGRYELTCAGPPGTQLATGTPPLLYANSLRPPPSTAGALRTGAVASAVVGALAAAGLLARRLR